MKGSNLPTGRFSNLLLDQDCPKPSYDRVLQRYDGCVVVPTLGSILPNWLLIVPEKPVLNFREWEEGSGLSADRLVRKFLRSRGISSASAIWFEHGPAKVGTSVGCGVDHAHLHVLIDAPFELEDFARTAAVESGSKFKSVPTNAALRGIRKDSSYLLIASGDHAIVAENVEHIGSQFLRRVVARLAGQPDAWNYRLHPWLNNVEETLRAFDPV
jgi:ATP adenylyltransferase